MRKIFISMSALLAIVSCSKDEVMDAPVVAPKAPVITATFENSRVSVSEDSNGQFELSWAADDKLSVFMGTGNMEYKHIGDGSFEAVSGEIGSELSVDANYAVYPYAEEVAIAADGTLTLTMPATQSYAEKSFGAGANTMVAATATKSATEYNFKNVGSYLRLSLYGNTTVKSIELKGNNDEPLAGEATVELTDNGPALTFGNAATKTITLDCGEGVKLGTTEAEATEFWFVVPVTEFDEGFTVTITDVNGNKMVKTTTNTFSAVRNTVKTMEAFNVVPEVIASDVILDVQFNSNGDAIDKGKYGLTIAKKEGTRMETITDPDYPYGNVVKFTNCDGANNHDPYTDSFYIIDYNENTAFKANLQDGFTLEMVVKHTLRSTSNKYPWQTFLAADTFAIHSRGTDDQFGRLGVLSVESNPYNSPMYDTKAIPFVPVLNKYYHYVYAYDKATNKVNIYCNGELVGERSGVTVGSGNRFAIGGYPQTLTTILHGFTGNVALVRIYDAVITGDTAKARYESLNIPSKDIETPVGEPLFDAQFGADGAAQNVGTSSLVIEPKLGTTVTTQKRGEHYVSVYTNVPSQLNNNTTTTGFYYVDYSSNTDYINKLKDGYTMEVVCKTNSFDGDFWVKPFSSSTTGFHHNKYASRQWGIYGNTQEDRWAVGFEPYGFPWTSYKASGASYEHLLLVYDAENYIFTLYLNGKRIEAINPLANITVGTSLAIGGKPYTDGTAAHTYVGEVAVARVYDEEMSDKQAMARYEEEKSVIDALNATL